MSTMFDENKIFSQFFVVQTEQFLFFLVNVYNQRILKVNFVVNEVSVNRLTG